MRAKPIRWILVGSYSVARFGNRVAVIKWFAGVGVGGDLCLVPSGVNAAEAFGSGEYVGAVTSVEAATRLLRKAR